jgi:small-conductance mechanosensitive channel
VFIVADAPYKLGDYIVLDSGERGEVTNIGIRSTRLLTRDDVEITVPNSIMGNAKIINETGGPYEKYRIRIKIGVAYGSNIEKVHTVLLDVADQHPDVCKDPEPRVRFRSFGNSSLDHELLCWVEMPVMRGKVTHMLNTDIYKRFIKEGIEIPFPQQDVHIRSMPE